jgi:hypothetical protein
VLTLAGIILDFLSFLERIPLGIGDLFSFIGEIEKIVRAIQEMLNDCEDQGEFSCNLDAKQGEANEDTGFCGNTHSLQMPKELVLGMPMGVLWINQDPTTTEEAMEKKVREAVPLVRLQWSQAEVALLFLATTEEQAQEFETKLAIARKAWKWRNAVREPQRLLSMLRSLCLQRQQSSPTEPLVRELAQEVVSILWEAQEGYQHDMTIGNGGSHHREERSWWAQGPGCFERISEWERWIQQDHSLTIEGMLEGVTFKNGRICVRVDDAQPPFQICIQDGRMTSGDTGKPSQVQPLAHVNPGQLAKENLETTVVRARFLPSYYNCTRARFFTSF